MIKGTLIRTTLFIMAAFTAGSLHGQTFSYEVMAETTLKFLSIEVCATGEPPSRMVAGDGAYEFLEEDPRYHLSKGRLYPDFDRHKCFGYAVDLKAAADAGGRASAWSPNKVLVPVNHWFWRPAFLLKEDTMRVRFRLPEGMRVSVPWQPLGDFHFEVPHTSRHWPGVSAFGHFQQQRILVEDGALMVSLLKPASEQPIAKFLPWMEQVSRTLAGVTGKFPRAHFQVLLVPSGRSGSAIPFAQILRGGTSSAVFYINPDQPIRNFVEDWTSWHEFSHLLLPFVSRDEPWVSEGLASYYQYLLMGRARVLDERHAWQRMYQAMRKAEQKADTTGDMDLEDISRDMHEYRAYRRVYWSGAILWLEADKELRRRSDNELSLDSLLTRLHACCGDSREMWSSEELAEKLDSFLETPLFGPLFAEYRKMMAFPDFRAQLAELGVIADGSRIQLDNRKSMAGVRKTMLE